MATMTAYPPPERPPRREIPVLRLPTDRLRRTYEEKFPEAAKEVVPAIQLDARESLSRSTLFVNKQYEFIKAGRSEKDAFALAEQALAEEEKAVLQHVLDLTAEARAGGAVPAISSIGVNDDRWDKLEFWRTELGDSSYELWPPGKQASFDQWLVSDILGWKPHYTRYMGKETFKDSIDRLRLALFADVIESFERDVRGGKRPGVPKRVLQQVHQKRALAMYEDWEQKMTARRLVDWPQEQANELDEWLDQYAMDILPNVQDPYPAFQGSRLKRERDAARRLIVQYMAFPMKRRELQGIPYLSPSLAKTFMQVAKPEAQTGFQEILQLYLNPRRADIPGAKERLPQLVPLLVVKTFYVVKHQRPCAWQLLSFLLRDQVFRAPVSAFHNISELASLKTPQEVAEHVEKLYEQIGKDLADIVVAPQGLKQSITRAYDSIHELHRIVEELIYLSLPSHAIEAAIEKELHKHHGLIPLDFAIGNALREHNPTVRTEADRAAVQAQQWQAEEEQEKSDVLEKARLDIAWKRRMDEQRRWEYEHNMPLWTEMENQTLTVSEDDWGHRPPVNPKDLLESYLTGAIDNETFKEHQALAALEQGTGEEGILDASDEEIEPIEETRKETRRKHQGIGKERGMDRRDGVVTSEEERRQAEGSEERHDATRGGKGAKEAVKDDNEREVLATLDELTGKSSKPLGRKGHGLKGQGRGDADAEEPSTLRQGPPRNRRR